MRDKMSLIGGTLLLIVVIASMSLFTVDQRQYAIVFQLGEIKEVISEPGLNAKLPFIQNVRYFDKRILTMDTPEPERFITSEKKNVLVNHFVKWRIIDPRLYYESVAGDEARARTRLTQTVNAGLREEFGRRTMHDVVSGERDAIMEQMRERADRDARTIGVQIVDVRLKRVDLPNEVSESVYRRMEAERKRVAKSCARWVPPRPNASAPTPTASARSSSPRPIARPRRPWVRATPRPPRSTPTPSARTRTSIPSTAASRPIGPVSRARMT